MNEKRTAESYEAEIKELRKIIEATEFELKETKAETKTLEYEYDCFQKMFAEKESEIKYYKGQIDAFKFCIACGKRDKDAK